MEPTPKPNDVEKFNLFGDALPLIVEHYFKEYVQKLEQYYRDMTELRVLDASLRDYFICEVCQFATVDNCGFWCRCEKGSTAVVCFRCVHLVRTLEIKNGACKCKVCGTILDVPSTVTDFPTNRFVKPRPPFLPRE